MLKPFYDETLTEAGCDEAGRGSFAGPVFAAAVILPKNFFHPLLNDSKQLTADQRNELRRVIEEKADDYAVASVTSEEIDRTNILKASIRAMHMAIALLKSDPDLLLVDGNRFYKYKKIPYRCFIKGDATYASIAAASILAKTYRDEYMLELHNRFPAYNWASNKGYGTPEHRRAIETFGICKYHRKSFRLLPSAASLFDC